MGIGGLALSLGLCCAFTEEASAGAPWSRLLVPEASALVPAPAGVPEVRDLETLDWALGYSGNFSAEETPGGTGSSNAGFGVPDPGPFEIGPSVPPHSWVGVCTLVSVPLDDAKAACLRQPSCSFLHGFPCDANQWRVCNSGNSSGDLLASLAKEGVTGPAACTVVLRDKVARKSSGNTVRRERGPAGGVSLASRGTDAGGSRSLSHNDCFNGPNCYEPHFEVLQAYGSPPSARAGMRAALHNSSGAMFVFGGTTSTDFYNDMYVYKLLERTWALCPRDGDAPPQVMHPAVALWEAEYTLFVFGGVDTLATTPVTLYSYTVTDDTIVNSEISGSWTSVAYGGSTPTGRYGHTAVFNEASSTMLVYGGTTFFLEMQDDIWSYDASSQTWAELTPGGTAPTGRYYHATAWAEAQQRMYISGGVTMDEFYQTSMLSDLFYYDVSTNSWTELTVSAPALGPPGRWGHSMVWLPNAERLLVFGGATGMVSTDAPSDTVFGFTAASNVWEEISHTGSITARDDHVAVWYDGAYQTTGDMVWDDHEAMLVFGGVDASSNLLGDLQHMWFKPATTTSATSTTTTFTSLTQSSTRTVLAPPECFNGPNCYDPHFEAVESSALPGARYESRAALHRSSLAWFIFGGSTSSGYLNDMYVYKVLEGAWALCPPSGTQPAALYQTSLAMWEGQYTLFMFGGMNADSVVANSLYSYTVSSEAINSDQEIDGAWALLSPSGSLPTARYGHTAVVNEAAASMLIFGGVTGTLASLNDLWSYSCNGTYWTQLSPSGTAPPARYYHATAWWPDQQRMFISGGIGLDMITFSFTSFADLFMYDTVANAWSQLTPSEFGIGAPGLYAHSIVFMTDAEQLLVLGGYQGVSNTMKDTLYGYDIASSTWSELAKTGEAEERVDHVAVWYQGDYNTEGHTEWDGFESMLVFGGMETSASTPTGELTRMWWRPATSTMSSATTQAPDFLTSTMSSTIAVSTTSVTAYGCFHTADCFDPHFEAVQSTGTSPGWLEGANSALHNASVALFVYGGHRYDKLLRNDLYIYKVLESQWASCPQNGADIPPLAMYTTMVLWEAQYKLFVYGGLTEGFMWPTDVFMYTVNSDTITNGEIDGEWSIAPSGSTNPGGRLGHVAVFNEATSTMIVFGGQGTDFLFTSEIWCYDAVSQNWTQKSPGGAIPGARGFHAGAWDALGERMFVHGGQKIDSATATFSTYDDLFVYDARADYWWQVSSNGKGISSPTLWQHAMVFIPSTESLLVFGGLEGTDDSVSVDTLYGFRTRGSMWENLSWTGSVPSGQSPVAVWLDGPRTTSGVTEWDRHEAMMLFVNDEHVQMWFKPPEPSTTTSAATGTSTGAIDSTTTGSSVTSSTRTSGTTVTGTATMSTVTSTSATSTSATRTSVTDSITRTTVTVTNTMTTATGTSTTSSSSAVSATSTATTITQSITATSGTTVTSTATMSTATRSTSASSISATSSTTSGTSTSTSFSATTGTSTVTGTTPTSTGTPSTTATSATITSNTDSITTTTVTVTTGTGTPTGSSTTTGSSVTTGTGTSASATSTTTVTMTSTITMTSTTETSSATATSASATSTSTTSASTTQTSSTDSTLTSSSTIISVTTTNEIGTISATVTSTIQSNAGTSSQLMGTVTLWFSDPDAVENDPGAEKLLSALGLMISQTVDMPASYVSVWYADSRRLTAATRQLTGGTLEAEFGIDVPTDSGADYDIYDAEATLNSANLSILTSLLQENVDSMFGEGVYSGVVLSIEAWVVDGSTSTAEDLGHAIPAESDGAQGSASVIIIIVVGAGCCLGSLFGIMALFRRRRRKRAPRPEGGDPAHGVCPSSAGAVDHTPSRNFILDVDTTGKTDARDRTQATLPSQGSAPMPRGPSGSGDQVLEDGEGSGLVYEKDSPGAIVFEPRQIPSTMAPSQASTMNAVPSVDVREDGDGSGLVYEKERPGAIDFEHRQIPSTMVPSTMKPVPRMLSPSRGRDQVLEDGDGSKGFFDMLNRDPSLVERRQEVLPSPMVPVPRLRSPSRGRDQERAHHQKGSLQEFLYGNWGKIDGDFEDRQIPSTMVPSTMKPVPRLPSPSRGRDQVLEHGEGSGHAFEKDSQGAILFEDRQIPSTMVPSTMTPVPRLPSPSRAGGQEGAHHQKGSPQEFYIGDSMDADETVLPEGDGFYSVLDIDNLDGSLFEHHLQAVAPSPMVPAPRLHSPSGGGDQVLPRMPVPSPSPRMSVPRSRSPHNLDASLFAQRQEVLPSPMVPVPRLRSPSRGGDQAPQVLEGGNGLEPVFDIDNPDHGQVLPDGDAFHSVLDINNLDASLSGHHLQAVAPSPMVPVPRLRSPSGRGDQAPQVIDDGDGVDTQYAGGGDQVLPRMAVPSPSPRMSVPRSRSPYNLDASLFAQRQEVFPSPMVPVPRLGSPSRGGDQAPQVLEGGDGLEPVFDIDNPDASRFEHTQEVVPSPRMPDPSLRSPYDLDVSLFAQRQEVAPSRMVPVPRLRSPSRGGDQVLGGGDGGDKRDAGGGDGGDTPVFDIDNPDTSLFEHVQEVIPSPRMADPRNPYNLDASLFAQRQEVLPSPMVPIARLRSSSPGGDQVIEDDEPIFDIDNPDASLSKHAQEVVPSPGMPVPRGRSRPSRPSRPQALEDGHGLDSDDNASLFEHHQEVAPSPIASRLEAAPPEASLLSRGFDYLRRRRRQSLPPEGDPAQRGCPSSAGAADGNTLEFLLDVDQTGEANAEKRPQVTAPSQSLAPRLRGHSRGGDQVLEDGPGLEFVLDIDDPDASPFERRQEVVPSPRMHVRGRRRQVREDDGPEPVFDNDNLEACLVEHGQELAPGSGTLAPSRGGTSGGGGQSAPEGAEEKLEFIFDIDKPMDFSQGTHP